MNYFITNIVCVSCIILMGVADSNKGKKAAVHLKEGNCLYKLATVQECDGKNQTLMYILKPRKHDITDNTCSPNKTVINSCSSQEKNVKKLHVDKKEQRKSQRAKHGNDKKIHLCNYAKGKWSDCADQGVKHMTLLLKSSSPSECKQNRTISVTCIDKKKNPRKKQGCRYIPGSWSKCSEMVENQERIDTLHNSSSSDCPPEKTITKACFIRNIFKCKYHFGIWSAECVDGNRYREETLQQGYSTQRCEKSRNITQNCLGVDEKETCFYGEWIEGSCDEKGKTRNDTREVIYGGEECPSGTIQTAKCNREQKVLAKKTARRLAKFEKINSHEKNPNVLSPKKHVNKKRSFEKNSFAPSVPKDMNKNHNGRKIYKRKQDKSERKNEAKSKREEKKENKKEVTKENKKLRKEQRELKKAEKKVSKETKKEEKVNKKTDQKEEKQKIDIKKTERKEKRRMRKQNRENKKITNKI